MGRYIGTAELLQWLSPQSQFSVNQNALLSSCIDWAETAINNYTRRNFAGTAGTVYYNRYEQDKVANQAFYLDQDLYSLTSITNGDGQNIPVGSVWLEPRNEGPPYRMIRLKSSYVWVWNTDSDVVVAGTFGYSTTPPDDIVGATTQLSAYYFKLKDTGPGDVVGFQEGGEQTIPKGIPETLKVLLAPYRSKTGGIV